MKIVVMADDLSGAAELGAIAVRRGLTAEVQTEFEPSTSADVCLIDTDSRLCPAETAVQRNARIARRILALPPVVVFKKVDSLLRGSVLAEIRATARTLGRPRVLLAAANPSRGRTIREGRYYVEGAPLHESPLAGDPEHPRRSSDVRELLERAGTGPLSGPIAAGLAEVSVAAPNVADADDLRACVAQLAPDVLPAGAADFFQELLAATFPAPAATSPVAAPPAPPRRTLLVCGSVAAWTRRRAEVEAAGAPVVQPPGAIFAPQRDESLLAAWSERLVEALEASPVVLAGLGEYPPRDGAELAAPPPSAVALVRRLADAVGRAIRRVSVDRFLLEGGATAAALVRQQGWSRLAVVGEPGPGVAELAPLEASGVGVRLLVKPGSYAWPDATWREVVAAVGRSNSTPT